MRYQLLRLSKLVARVVISFGVPATAIALLAGYHRPSNAALVANATGSDMLVLIDERTAKRTSLVNDYT